MSHHRPMSPLASDLFAMLGDALRPDPALDSLARVDAALSGITTGRTSLLPIAHRVDTAKVFRLARLHLGTGDMESSARACLADAVRLFDESPQYSQQALVLALRSLAYSVGILHADYARAFHASGIGGEVRLV